MRGDTCCTGYRTSDYTGCAAEVLEPKRPGPGNIKHRHELPVGVHDPDSRQTAASRGRYHEPEHHEAYQHVGPNVLPLTSHDAFGQQA